MSNAIFGLGLRHAHHQYVLQNNPKVDFFEVHSENFIAQGGASIDFLSKVAALYPLSFHCVGLSLGSSHGLDKKHLKDIKHLLDLFNPILFSDHLSWSESSDSGTSNDLLPIPYTKEALNVFCNNVNQAQDFFGREILVENPSAYLEFSESEMSEIDFLNELSHKTKCGILLDINNVYVGAKNFEFDPVEYLNQVNLDRVKEIHLAGHSVYQYKTQEIRIDTHSTTMCDDVLELYQNFVKKSNIKVPTLIEWDEEIPEFSVLLNEIERAKSVV